MTALKLAVAAACGWETVAITSGRIPTISILCGRHRWLCPLIIGGLTVHLLRPPRKEAP